MESETNAAPLTVRNGPSSIPKLSKIPTPSTGRKRAVAIEGQENLPLEPAPKRPKMTATVKPIAVVQAKKSAVRGNTTAKAPVKAPAKKPGVKPTTTKPPSRSSSSKTQGFPVAKPAPKAAAATASVDAKGGAKGGGKQKRAAWDLKGRLQDVEVERNESNKTVNALSMEMTLVRERLDSLMSEHSQQGNTLKMKQEETSLASQTIKDLEAKCDIQHKRLTSLQREHETLQTIRAGLEMDLAATRSALSQLTADASTLQCRYDAMKVSKDETVAESAEKSRTISELQATVQEQLATIAECETRRREDETVRRQLHNTIQELKGNIRVFCRVRPVLPGELDGRRGSQGSSKAATAGTESKLDVAFPDLNQDCKQISLAYSSDQATCTGAAAGPKSYSFEFDRVFGPGSTQQSVFTEISQLVQSALDGYNVCIFAYGQTGSGKTHTMEGAGGDGGMIPRAVEQVFTSAQALEQQGWEYSMQASFLEIYNETIRDLLTSSVNNISKAMPTIQHDIKLDPSVPGGVYVTNVEPTSVTSQEQVASLLERANRNRAVAATNCNERSSRSHSVFRLQLTGSNDITGEKCKGSLNLVDLAGSERLAQSGSVGERLKETKNINKSLSNLGLVIMALANKDPHIPYRNSKLTFLLQNSLGGNSKTLMFVNMSPLAISLQETLCSLRFATKVNQCNIGTARKASK